MEVLDYRDWRRPAEVGGDVYRDRVSAMLKAIQEGGDDQIQAYSEQFDGFAPHIIELQPWDRYDLSDDLRKHLPIAKARIERFAQAQRDSIHDLDMEDEYGRYGHRVIALDSMAAYIPGGRFPLVSTALMTLVPAKVAGVGTRVAVSPSDHPGVLAAASLAGATKFIHMGGAQAVAALAFGSRWQEAVDMIVGPGNAYVNAAKGLVQDRVKIDTLAGPSEILILCDDTIDPSWVALDVLAQAEHDPMALSVLGGISRETLDAVAGAIEEEAAKHPDRDKGIIQLVHCPDGEALRHLADAMAAEHLHVACGKETLDPMTLRHYGSLFIGPYSAVAMGDYCTGPNHTLPTMAAARQKGGLMVGDFLKTLTYQELNGERFNDLASTGLAMATVEDLAYHRQSIEIRMK